MKSKNEKNSERQEIRNPSALSKATRGSDSQPDPEYGDPAGPGEPNGHPNEKMAMRRDAVESRLYNKNRLNEFLPIKAPVGWNRRKDVQAFVQIWGGVFDCRQETFALLESNFKQVNVVLDAGINYFKLRCGNIDILPCSVLNLSEKVALFTKLLPNREDQDYALRFSLTLTKLLWLDSERKRINDDWTNGCFLYPHYSLADSFLGTAAELNESLGCEHSDFKQPEIEVYFPGQDETACNE